MDQWLTKWIIPDFWGLHPQHAFCWHEIVCPDNTEGLIKKMQGIGVIVDGKSSKSLVENKENLKSGFYKINTISGNLDKWESIKKIKMRKKRGTKFRSFGETPIGSLEEFDKEIDGIIKYEGEEISREFSPKSRIILSKGENKRL